MPVSDPSGSTVIELSRAEQWVVHHVLLESIGLADGEPGDPTDSTDLPQRSLAVLEKLEAGSFEFTLDELTFIRRACDRHASTTRATADKNLASSVADRIESTVHGRSLELE